MGKLVETLIGRLEEKSSFYITGLGCMGHGVKAISISEAKKIINELAEEHKCGWIPCGGCKDCQHKECENYGKV